MKRWLLDNNVVSEPGKARPDPAVMAWLRRHQDAWLTELIGNCFLDVARFSLGARIFSSV